MAKTRSPKSASSAKPASLRPLMMCSSDGFRKLRQGTDGCPEGNPGPLFEDRIGVGTQNVSLTLATVEGLSKEARRWNTRNQGSSQLTVWQWLTRAHRGKLTSRPRIQKQTKQEDTKTLATIQNFRRRQERYRPKQTETQPTLQGPSSTTMWV